MEMGIGCAPSLAELACHSLVLPSTIISALCLFAFFLSYSNYNLMTIWSNSNLDSNRGLSLACTVFIAPTVESESILLESAFFSNSWASGAGLLGTKAAAIAFINPEFAISGVPRLASQGKLARLGSLCLLTEALWMAVVGFRSNLRGSWSASSGNPVEAMVGRSCLENHVHLGLECLRLFTGVNTSPLQQMLAVILFKMFSQAQNCDCLVGIELAFRVLCLEHVH
jgi:hypothetical protein